MSPKETRVSIVGYGEVGRIFGAALVKAGVQSVSAFDVLLADAAWAAQARLHATANGVTLANDRRQAVVQAKLVISAVTAASASKAIDEIAAVLPRGAFVLDGNSASPRTKKACGEVIDRAGGKYVEAAIMGAVPASGIAVPMLLGGPHAEAIAPLLAQLGFDASVGSADYGVVSAIKLCRSVVMKGMEALAIESLLAARRYGVEKEVLASLAESYPGLDWTKQADYLWRRVVQHGRRRAEEMREAAVAVEDMGCEPRMASATAEVQAWIAELKAQGVFGANAKDAQWRDLADAIEHSK